MSTQNTRIDCNLNVPDDERRPTYTERSVVFKGDGEPKTPAAMIRQLANMESSGQLEMDSYSLGGCVEKLEKTFAEMLAKEAAIFLPTGTMANHLALRKLCEHRPRAIVQHDSHQYNDTGDCATLLSGINMIPIAEGRPYFTVSELIKKIEILESGRVATPLGAVMIESPVRRQYGQVMPYDEMEAVTKFCAERGIGTHLDAARLYMMTTATSIPPSVYAGLFDTVYVSLYKYFGSPYGAILAGKSDLISDLYHQRRMLGGSLASAYLAAALALNGSVGFEDKFAAAMKKGEVLFEQLNNLDGLNIETYKNGSNIFPVDLDADVNLKIFQKVLQEKSVFFYPDENTDDHLHLTVNTTILRMPNENLVTKFSQALTKSKNVLPSSDV